MRLRGAAGLAVEEILRLHRQLSRFESQSELSRINRLAARKLVPVEPELFAFLQQCRDLSAATDGAFDIALGGGAVVLLDPDHRTVRFGRAGTAIDAGGIGKGYAVERAMEYLAEAGIANALIHAGTSSVCARGSAPDGSGWPVGIGGLCATGSLPASVVPGDPSTGRQAASGIPPSEPPLAVVHLHDQAVSISERARALDPRTGRTADGAALAAVVHPSATVAEALSTALLVRGAELLDLLPDRFPGTTALLLDEGADAPTRILGQGWEIR
ncbi:MAG: FAD:protein FMN transferase [Armatimonadetes bacterium]|nr:FAD:protein FMN transferase [Armatimonadota bacterium]